MAYAMTKQGSLTNFITYEFICDTVADMNAIETEYRTLGSVAIVLAGESGMEVYMAGSDKEWNSLTSLGGNAAPPGLTIYICGQNEVSNGLPDVEEPDDTTLYLIPAQNETNNLYEEYVWVNDGWEKFGGATLDLSGYATLQDIAGFYTKPNGGIPVSDLAESYVKTTDIATQSTAGLVKVLNNGNVTFNENNQLVLTLAGTAVVKTGQSDHPISVTHQHEAAFYGLAKAAGQDMKNSGNAVGTYTTEAANAIRTMIGAGTYSKPASGIPASDLAETYLTQHQDISGKANISDLATVATSGNYNDLNNKPNIPTVPTNVSAFTNDAGYGTYTKPNGGIPAADLAETYLTQHQDISNLATKSEIPDVSGFYTKPAGGIPATDLAETYLTQHQSLDSYAPKANPVFTGSISMGRAANSTVGNSSTALGSNVTASGDYSHAEGTFTRATADSAHAEGLGSSATGLYSHVEGSGTGASNANAHAEGSGTQASGGASHAEGTGTQASGSGSHAEGGGTTASGDYSHTEGGGTTASGNYAHAEGSSTTATGRATHAQGQYNILFVPYPNWTANTSYAVGDKVTGEYGYGYKCITANSDTTFTAAKWEKLPGNTDEQFVIGNGTAGNARSNAFAVYWNGDTRTAGDVYVHCNNDSTGGTKLATETFVNTAVGAIDLSSYATVAALNALTQRVAELESEITSLRNALNLLNVPENVVTGADGTPVTDEALNYVEFDEPTT